MLAAENKRVNVFRAMLNYIKDWDLDESQLKNDVDTLHAATRSGNKWILKSILSSKINVDTRNDEEETPLHIACANNKLESASCLIEQ